MPARSTRPCRRAWRCGRPAPSASSSSSKRRLRCKALQPSLQALPRQAHAPAPSRARCARPFIERQAALVERLRGIGAQDIQPLWLEHALALEMPRSRVKDVAQWPAIRRVQSDFVLRGPARPSLAARGDPRLAERQDEQARAALSRASTTAAPAAALQAPAAGEAPWELAEHLAAIDAPRAWLAGLDGRGTTVAVVDSGVDLRVPALALSFRGGAADWFDPYGQHRLPHDAQGHGTLVASLLAGRAAGGAAPLATAPAARFIAARLFDDAGQGRLSAVHRIYQWLLDPDGDEHTPDAPQVVNNSWGLAGTTDQCNVLLARVWQAMALADVAVVFAAGNDGPHERTSMSPANNPGVVSVGALDADGAVSRQSSRGPSACDAAGAPRLPFPTLHAPGIALPALDRIGASAGVAQRSDGTSFAAAVASGTLLLLRQREPEWSVAQLVAALAGQAVAAAPGLPPSVHAGALAAAPAERAHLQVLRPADGRLDTQTLRSVLPRSLSVQRIEPASPGSPLPAGLALHGDHAVWQPQAGAADTGIELRLVLSDDTRLPLRVMQPAAPTTASAGAEARVFAARRDTPVALAAEATPAPADAAAWSQPLRGGRIVRDAEGRWWYRPPAGFVGTDQFALRTAEGVQPYKVVVRP
ncbi:MAG: S8 family serine peptidase [Rubrivivax sp.]